MNKEMDKEIILVNNLIGAGVLHGSDAGGTYNQTPEDIKLRMEEYLKYKGWTDKYDINMDGGYYTITYGKEIGWPAPQFVLKK